MFAKALEFLWSTGQMFLSWELDFGDVSFSLWQFCLGAAALSLIIYLIRRHFE